MADIDYRVKIYDIVLTARTEGIVGGKTKRFASGDTDEILRTVIAKGKVCDNCDGTGTEFRGFGCPKCKSTGKLDVTIDDAIKGYIGYYSQETK